MVGCRFDSGADRSLFLGLPAHAVRFGQGVPLHGVLLSRLCAERVLSKRQGMGTEKLVDYLCGVYSGSLSVYRDALQDAVRVPLYPAVHRHVGGDDYGVPDGEGDRKEQGGAVCGILREILAAILPVHFLLPDYPLGHCDGAACDEPRGHSALGVCAATDYYDDYCRSYTTYQVV